METKTPVKTKFKRIAIVVLSIVIGVAMVASFISRKQPPERVEAVEAARGVRVIEVATLPLVIQASGFGTATPDQTWSAISSVKGHVVYRNDNLESGEVVTSGTLLLEIDPGSYELALTEANADIAGIDAEIAQLNQEAINANTLLELERERLDLAELDLKRTEGLLSAGAVPQSAYDTQLRATLQQRQAVQALINQQNIIPIQLGRLEAQKERALVKRAQVERDLAETKFYAPFDMRISEVAIEMYQNINPGQLLFSGDGITASEVVLQVPMQSLRRLISEIPEDGDTLDLTMIEAQVKLVGEDQSWQAEVIRIANGIDPATRTVRVVLSVPQPKGILDPVNNPPLPKGMYVEGILRAKAQDPQIIVPQQVIHEGWIYLVDDENRLSRHEVDVAFQQAGMAIIESGLAVGDMVILDDIVPAIAGQLLDLNHDLEVEAALKATAAGVDK